MTSWCYSLISTPCIHPLLENIISVSRQWSGKDCGPAGPVYGGLRLDAHDSALEENAGAIPELPKRAPGEGDAILPQVITRLVESRKDVKKLLKTCRVADFAVSMGVESYQVATLRLVINWISDRRH